MADCLDLVQDLLDPPPPRPEIASPVAFAEAHSRGQYLRYRHVEVIEQAILDTIATGGRLVLSASVRHSKSQTASLWLPAWYLGTHPDRRVILAGHEADFAARWGRGARDILTEYGPDAFGVSVSGSSQAANRWDLARPHHGGMLTIGVGGSPIGRGADLCIASGTLIETPQGPIRIDTLANEGGTIWAYDRAVGAPIQARITGASQSISCDLVEIEFRSGRRLRCTPDHRIAVEGRGYLEARLVHEGDEVPALGGVGVPDLRRGVPPGRQRVREEEAAGAGALLLLAEVRWQRLRPSSVEALRAVPRADGAEGPAVLQGVHLDRQERGQASAHRQGVPGLSGYVPTEAVASGFLHAGLREPSARRPHDRQGELPLQGRHELLPVVPADAPADHGARRWLCRVWDHRGAAHPSHRRGRGEQPAGEPGVAVQSAPPHAPQVSCDAVAVVRHLRPGCHTVYDLEVEGAHNFFAGQVLVHNCIIDDPVKSYQDAMSPLVRQRVKEWWSGTMASRVEPGGAVILIMARWHEDDLAGFLLRESPDQWRELRLPAVCDDPDQDPLGRALGEPLWPERWPAEALDQRRQEVSLSLGEAIWLAQYQQRPAPPGGGMFPEKKWGFIARDEVPVWLTWVRAWDLAATEDAGDWTVGARMAQLPDGRFVIDDVVRGQWDSRRVRREILDAADRDPSRLAIELPQDPGQAGKDQAQQMVAMLAGHNVRARPVTGSKEVRATGYAAQQQAGNVVLVEGDWNGTWVAEHAAFPRGAHDDQVDTGATAFNRLSGRAFAPVVSPGGVAQASQNRVG